MNIELISKHEAGKILGCSPETLKRYRQIGLLKSDIHYRQWNSRVTRYQKALIEDLAINRNDPVAHARAIAAYLESLKTGV